MILVSTISTSFGISFVALGPVTAGEYSAVALGPETLPRRVERPKRGANRKEWADWATRTVPSSRDTPLCIRNDRNCWKAKELQSIMVTFRNCKYKWVVCWKMHTNTLANGFQILSNSVVQEPFCHLMSFAVLVSTAVGYHALTLWDWHHLENATFLKLRWSLRGPLIHDESFFIVFIFQAFLRRNSGPQAENEILPQALKTKRKALSSFYTIFSGVQEDESKRPFAEWNFCQDLAPLSCRLLQLYVDSYALYGVLSISVSLLLPSHGQT